MKTPLSLLLVLLTTFVGCKKSQQQPDTHLSDHDLSKMNGTHIAIGTGTPSTNTSPPDAFSQFTLSQVDANTVVIGSDRLSYSKTDSVTHVIEYLSTTSFPGYAQTYLHFDPATNSLQYGTKSGGSSDASFYLNTQAYKPNPSLKNYISSIQGTKNLHASGSEMLGHQTTSYSLNLTITFTAINDSTIAFDNNHLQLDDSILHYKRTDDTVGTITFEAFHILSYSISRLTYIFSSNSLVFEQHYMSSNINRYLIAQ